MISLASSPVETRSKIEVSAGTASRTPIVTIAGLTKRFPVRRPLRSALRHPFQSQTVEVLSNLSCEISEGEVFALLGPNGAGKTTLLKILSTLVTPDAGVVTVAGHDLQGDPASVRRLLAPVIADERSLDWRLSARENLRFFASLHGMRGSGLRDRVDELLQAVELTETGEKLVGAFSSGMKQRLLIARALVSSPRVLLLDEPTRSLDPLAARRFRSFLREQIVRGQGCSVLLATHLAEEALHLCDRVGVLSGGRLLSVGAPQELAFRLGDQGYRVWTRTPGHGSFSRLAERGAIGRFSTTARVEGGYTAVEFEVAGGDDHAAEVLSTLVREGVTVARYERVQLSIADLIERVISKASAGGEA